MSGERRDRLNERLQADLRATLAEVQASRTRVVEEGLRQRRQLERDLHDGAQARLVSLALTLRTARAKLEEDPRKADELLERSTEELDQALDELRRLARGIHPPILGDRGLEAAIAALANRIPLPVDVAHIPHERLPEQVEATAYFVVSEALTNVAKHAMAHRASIVIARGAGSVTVEVSDDGVGGADLGRGTGIRGLADRVEAIDGRLELESVRGQGTRVRARLPIS